MHYISDQEIDRLRGDTGALLSAEKRVKLIIAGNSEDAPWEGGLNGHFFRIRRGMEVAVPESLARLIAESAAVQRMSEAAVRPYKGGRGRKLSG